jgi:hypothetical protein
LSNIDTNWNNLNYFNYFTEVEEHFQRARGTGLFLLSPLDWALIEAWKNSGVPLEAVLRGIDIAFEKWRSKKSKVQAVNSLAYCSQAVLDTAQKLGEATGSGETTQADNKASDSFCRLEDLVGYLEKNSANLRKPGPEFEEIAAALDRLRADAETHFKDLEALEQRLSVLEEKMLSIARARQSEDDALAARQELDRHLRPYRGKMTADQLKMLQGQFLDRQLLEKSGLPRLSLFYLR